MTGADDRGRFLVDEEPEGLPIAGDDCLDCGPFIRDWPADGDKRL